MIKTEGATVRVFEWDALRTEGAEVSKQTFDIHMNKNKFRIQYYFLGGVKGHAGNLEDHEGYVHKRCVMETSAVCKDAWGWLAHLRHAS